ncbi:MAG TPA: cupin domain-containing protein [Ktedonobacterales bacterium]|nr:cupin domain-containing protein [Ktedonobacterales bacterium]
MQAFELSQLLSEAGPAGEVHYNEFLRQPSLSMGIYTLAAGALDPQQPHTEDEVYYIVSGQGSIRVGDENQLVQAGSVVFVAANVPHRFFNITEDLTILVFFAPAENTLAAKTGENSTSAS